jgi:DNA uptake protein ComE-like DNA-binding protein
MVRLKKFFDFSTGQLRFLLVLGVMAVILTLALFVRTYTVAPPNSTKLPVLLGKPDSKLTGTFVLDPNTAPVDSLELLPGIGKVLADRIVEYRQHHVFEHEVDITEVRGIGSRLYERIRPYLCIRHR